MPLIAIVEDGLVVLGQKALLGKADRNHDRAELATNRVVSVGDGLLRRTPVHPEQIMMSLAAGKPSYDVLSAFI